MSVEKARQQIMSMFEAGWTGGDAFPVERPNRPFTVPDAGTWGRLSIQFGGRDPASLGKRKHSRQTGVIFLQVFNPEKGGTAGGTKAEDLFRTIYDQEQIVIEPGLYLTFDLVGNQGTGQIRGKEQTNIAVDFRVDHHT